ncbi:MAG: hypothetical protein ACOYPS_12780 [Phycisphaerales bacterium]
MVEVDAAAACTTPVTYQWQRRDPSVLDPASSDAWIDLSDGAGVFGSRGPNLTLLAPTLAFATGFRCRVGGGCGCESGPGTFTFSETVTYSLNCPADFNADGGIDFSDVEAFFQRWENGC